MSKLSDRFKEVDEHGNLSKQIKKAIELAKKHELFEAVEFLEGFIIKQIVIEKKHTMNVANALFCHVFGCIILMTVRAFLPIVMPSSLKRI